MFTLKANFQGKSGITDLEGPLFRIVLELLNAAFLIFRYLGFINNFASKHMRVQNHVLSILRWGNRSLEEYKELNHS